MIKKMSVLLFTLVLVFFAIPDSSYAQPLMLKLARVLSYQKKYDEAIERYREHLKSHPGDFQAHLELGDVLYWTGNYDGALEEYRKASDSKKLASVTNRKIADILAIKKDYSAAEELYRKVLLNKPGDVEAHTKYAQMLSYSKRYDEALAEYDNVLEKDPDNLKALEGKAEVLSWARKYDESVETYDKYLSLKYDAKIHRQKARVLGWAKRFDEGIATYNEAYERTGLNVIDLEMRSKQALWNKGVLKALKRYRHLLELEPDNVEARFDLAEVEAYQRMWKQATENYQIILNKYSDHFRARDGLEKVRLLWKKRAFIPEFFWYRAKSDDRATNINRLSAGGTFEVPFSQAVSAVAGYRFDNFLYGNRRSVRRHQGTVGLDVSLTPYLWANAYYLPTGYTTFNRLNHLFEGSVSARPIDPIILTLMTKREDLVNTRGVFEKKLRKTDVGGQIQADIHRRWTAYGNYSYSDYNDGNYRNAFGVENLVYVMFEPKRLTVDVKFDFQDFKRMVTDYWSPNNFWSTSITIHWRHYLNPEGMYFGAKNTYYGLKYRFSVDKEKEIFNGGTLEFYHDFNRYFAVQFEGFANYSKVYYDVGTFLSAVTRF